MQKTAFQQKLDSHTRPAELTAKAAAGAPPQCLACAHQCRLAADGDRGICRLRFNRQGTIMAPYGYVAGLACDPIEKKPLYHFLPGSSVFSFGMLGCNFHCRFCQNWMSSQTLRDPKAVADIRPCTPEELIEIAQAQNCRAVAATYNEPLITSEWAVAIFRRARQRGLATCYVSNGFASPASLEYLDPWLDAANIDLKCFSEEGYRQLGGRLPPVLDTIRDLHRRKKWLETTTLIVPGFNDHPAELRELTDFLASVDPLIPWHVSAYHATYKMGRSLARTPLAALHAAVEIGREAGLRYIYTGNLPGSEEMADTRCHGCGCIVARRERMSILALEVGESGDCPQCKAKIPGLWSG